MSSFEDGARALETQQQQRKGDSAYLSQEEREMVRRILRFPEEFPREFGGWIEDYVSTNASLRGYQIQGLRQNFAKVQDNGNTLVDITSSADPKSLFDASTHSSETGWKIAGGLMGSNRMLRLSILGDALYANADSDNCTLKVYVNGNLLVTNPDMFSTGLPSGSREQFTCTAEVIAVGTEAQMGRLTTATRFTFGSMFSSLSPTAVDTEEDWYLDVVAEWTTATVNLSLRNFAWVLELV